MKRKEKKLLVMQNRSVLTSSRRKFIITNNKFIPKLPSAFNENLDIE
jgi:hypothetical protein